MHQVALDARGIVVSRQAPSLADTPDMGVHDHARVPEDPTQDDIGGLAADAVELEQFLHGPRHDSAKLLFKLTRHHLDGPCLLMVEPGGLDVALQFHQIRRHEVGGGPVPREQRRCHLVHLRVGALGREDRRHQQLQGVAVAQRQTRDRVALGQHVRDLSGTRAATAECLTGRQPVLVGGHGPRRFRRHPRSILLGQAGNAPPAPKPRESPHDKEAAWCTPIGSRARALR
jgi:hypothetical protein